MWNLSDSTFLVWKSIHPTQANIVHINVLRGRDTNLPAEYVSV